MERFMSYKRVTIDGQTVEYDHLSAYFDKATLSQSPLVYQINPEEEARPDLIAQNHYGSWTYWWAVMVFNDIIDPFTELTPGKVLRLPSESDLISQINAFKKVNR